MVEVTLRLNSPGFHFDVRQINLSEAHFQSDAVSLTDRTGETLGPVDLAGVLEWSFVASDSLTRQGLWNVQDFVFGPGNTLAGGTITEFLTLRQIGAAPVTVVDMVMRGLSISAVAFQAAIDTVDDPLDDRALFAAALAGDDVIRLGDHNDRFAGMGGDDYLRGHGGTDRLFGGAGADLLVGDGGNDVLKGGKGYDLFDGGAGADVIVTGAGRDDVLLWADSGWDVVTDFTDQRDQIRMDIRRADFGDVHIADGAEGAVISYGAAQLTLLGVDADRIDIHDFFFIG
ncbi:Hemolysin-type calcium-binding repeat-containing protein [Gemmobacter aquatilis]|uniref:Hemolysin-type calcium-binding repeat-containing protein n=2 Tax=Gemmobacter aquatilis TaxID=933059 RepID=A0A1H8IVQ9_9RHOB|nr:Hemolysin-type calcium-binding repeat-containing protein [Gemmobacter aquatilis]